MNRACCFALLTLLASAPARADVDDEKPWDWERYNGLVLRNAAQNGACDATASELKNPDLQCTFDKPSWDAHLQKELKIERIRDRNRVEPGECMYDGLQFFRPTSSNGGYPDVEPVTAEFKQNVAAINCRFDDVDRAPFLTYDAGKRTLVIHLTRKQQTNPSWIHDELTKQAKALPALNKYWHAHS